MIATQKATERTNGAITLAEAAKKDARGEALPNAPPTTFMANLDAKASEKVEVSRGTLWFTATALVLLGVVFSYGSSMLGWIREDESQRAKTIQIQAMLEAMQKQQDQLNEKLARIERDLQEQRVSTAKKEGYELGQTDAGATGHKNQ